MDFRIDGNSVSFWLKVKPRSPRERLGLDSAGELRLEIHAAASEGKANEACIQFLARCLGLPQNSVAILAGNKSRRKLLRITGCSAEETAQQLMTLAHSRGERRVKIKSEKW